MAYTHRRVIQWTSSSGSYSNTRSQSADAEVEATVTVAAETTSVVEIAIPYDSLSGLFMSADGELTVETNAASSGADDSFELAANQPVHYLAGASELNPLTADVTEIHLTNYGDSAVEFNLRAIYEPVGA
jgi:hypothetical protein